MMQGFSDVFDLRVLREAELKHGRFAMLAVLGFIVQETYTLPFFPKMAPVDAHDYFVQQGGGSQIIFWISFVEIFGVVALFETLQGKREPGDFAFDPLGLAKDEATLERYRLAEIKHSRLAMIAIAGETKRVATGEWPTDDNPLVNSPHTVGMVTDDNWLHPYSRANAAYPIETLRRSKYWSPVSRVDNVHGDRNLVCTCPPLEAYMDAAE